MSGHTPGPWVASKRGARWVVSAAGVLGGRAGAGLKVLWQVANGRPQDGEAAQANARLIAAAPELLAAAQKALLRLDREDAARLSTGDAVPHQGVPGSVNDQLRMAIAKAEGRS